VTGGHRFERDAFFNMFNSFSNIEYEEIVQPEANQRLFSQLLSTSHPESGEIIGWTHLYGDSPIVYIQPGHDHHAYENPNYRHLVRQAIEWINDQIRS
jgi:type 1 glutamine amidotransferase